MADTVGLTMGELDRLQIMTRIAERRLTLGYRDARLASACALGLAGTRFRAHEFHFARTVSTGAAAPAE